MAFGALLLPVIFFPMYPVLSMLRKLAASTVLVQKHQLKEEKGVYVLPIERGAKWLDPATEKWISGQVPFQELVATAPSELQRAFDLLRAENELGELLENVLYTIFLEHEDDDGTSRRVRLAGVRGAFTWKGGQAYRAKKKTLGVRSSSMSLPPGTVREIR